jgi:hypothetical protein
VKFKFDLSDISQSPRFNQELENAGYSREGMNVLKEENEKLIKREQFSSETKTKQLPNSNKDHL